MRGDRGSGCAAGGCGGLSLVGLLVTLVLMGLLGGRVIDGVSNIRSPSGDTDARAVPAPASVDVAIAPTTDVVDGTPTLVTSTAFDQGSAVTISMCLDPSVTQYVGGDACDPSTAATYAVLDPAGLREPFSVQRAITVHGIPHDCALRPGRCRVVATATVSSREAAGGRPVTFRPGLPPVDLRPRTDVPRSDHLPIAGSPSGTLAPATRVHITARGFRPGEPVLVGYCTDAVEEDGLLACSSVMDGWDALAAITGDLAEVRDHAAPDGTFTTTVIVKRRVDPMLGDPVDCTARAGRCSIGVMAAVDSRRSGLLPYTVRHR